MSEHTLRRCFSFWGRLPGVTHEQALANTSLFVDPRVRDAVKV
jgi:hypothetical protein